MTTHRAPVYGVAAGVPFLAVPPPGTEANNASVVVAWHLMDPPRTEAAFAAALPLTGLVAWRIYLGLPMCGDRLPAGGYDELMRLGYEDAVLNLQGPIATRGAEEFPAALSELRERFGLTERPLGLMGGSMGSAVAELVLTETGPGAGIPVAAAVLVSPIARLRPAVNAISRRFGITYSWGPASLEVARKLDFVRRAEEIAGAGQPAIRLIVGADDDRDGFIEPTRQLHAALSTRYAEPSRVDFRVVPDMAHALAEEPGIEPAPQTAPAAIVDQLAVQWFQRHLDDSTLVMP